jgi:hypothetical protein
VLTSDVFLTRANETAPGNRDAAGLMDDEAPFPMSEDLPDTGDGGETLLDTAPDAMTQEALHPYLVLCQFQPPEPMMPVTVGPAVLAETWYANMPEGRVSVPALAAEIVYRIESALPSVDVHFQSETLAGCSVHVAMAPSAQTTTPGRGVSIEFSGPRQIIGLLETHAAGLRQYLAENGVSVRDLRLVPVRNVPLSPEGSRHDGSGERRRRRDDDSD